MDSFIIFRQQFDPLFIRYLEQKVSALADYDAIPSAIADQIVAIATEGKRLRPFVSFVASGELLDSLASSAILPLLYGIELYHLFALIHDDIIDQSDTRHGVRTLHLQFDISTAILVGDLCLSWAHECIATYYDSPYLSVIFSALSEETILGQLLETTLAYTIDPTLPLIDRIMELKTARYTFIYPMLLGRAYAIGSSYVETSGLVRFARALGHAYQRLDNMADVFLEEDYLGKESCADFRNGTHTHLSLYVCDWGTVVEQNTFHTLFGNRDASVSSIRTLLITSGAYAYEKRSISKLLAEARIAMHSMPNMEQFEPCIAILESKLSMF